MNIIETATDVIVLIWMMLVTAYTMMLNKKVNEIRDERSKQIGQIYDELRELEMDCENLGNSLASLLGLRHDMIELERDFKGSAHRTVDEIKRHKEALRELYEYAQKAGEIRSDMLSKITDLERCAQAHEAWIIEQEEKQWKD